ncbi:E3 ubiquitin-protein ligase PRT6 isoform X2 [Physcomitrium patens]|nr:E3 ubiquitin-protein ligase PRT6-like isoform X2 [Physcomitrium patens]XP_024382981.1 E3 ubiquitin-protein ligase PRT6-like isoform X2 [Physcomitrium patens]XP_024382982.1 E3 ubiquitin-protein ligase PRT6-like isoform X2 [Physcomitrium patens]PNR49187.1 hypothetical protein PHYPA_011083 [Physcomitrium patens]|eukprot:XP_024382980.1 E3 ubiquitin-protein ligase PRT6-like isoform X2 [Physcomitrella patens]
MEELEAVSTTDADEAQGPGTRKGFLSQCRDAIEWVKWVMFQGEPQAILEVAGQGGGGARGVCGAVWGVNDIAYRCRTCEHDPTCAICVSCFQLGNHSTHDYYIMRTGGGCCDCGDITAWKQAGFCSRHSGFGQAVSLPSSIEEAATPVLEALLIHWVRWLKAADAVTEGKSKIWKNLKVEEKVASQLSVVCVELLMELCSYGETMLAFIADLMGKNASGILDTLMNTEHFLPKPVSASLHELLYKLLGDSNFKLSFAKVFISHYPKFFKDSAAAESAAIGITSTSKYSEQAILNSFSVQIFTVPTLTPKLVIESRLLEMLLGTLKEFFLACAGEDGRLLGSKGLLVKRLYHRILEDIRYVMNHFEVAKYVAERKPELLRAWLHLLAFVQGMYPQRRMTGIHVEEDNEVWSSGYFLESQMASIHSLFVAGAAAASNASFEETYLSKPCGSFGFVKEALGNGESFSRPVRIGCVLREPNETAGASGSGPSEAVVEMRDATVTVDAVEGIQSEIVPHPVEKKDVGFVSPARMTMPASLVWLISECTQVLDTWLRLDAAREVAKSGQSGCEGGQESEQRSATQVQHGKGRFLSVPQNQGDVDVDIGEAEPVAKAGVTEWWMGSEPVHLAPTANCEVDEWAVVDFDVSRQEVSFHIPLHRMLGLLLHKALDYFALYTEASAGPAFVSPNVHASGERFLAQMFPPGFTSVLLEHPLRLQVLCAQVQAGMWRYNGISSNDLSILYHTVHWCEDSLELDLFLLQCCAVMAPPEEFVERLQVRFLLSDYFTLVLSCPNEYEVTLAQELLVLMIRLVSERGFCGITEVDAIRRDLVWRLAVGDATHSVLLKALSPRLRGSKHVQEILNSVATYRNPSGMQQGKYVLREDYWCELDLYHLRWNSRNIQVAEDRYLRARKVPAMFVQLPRWKQPYKQFQNLGQFSICRRVHDMLRSVFFHAAFAENPSKSRAPEGLLLSALHLLALALDVCSAYKMSAEGATPGASSTISRPLGLDMCSTDKNCEDTPPLLLDSVKRVAVAREDGSMMEEQQSMLSTLVLVLRKNNTGDNMATSALGNFRVGGLIKNLLLRFGELNQNCLGEIELLAPEIFQRTPATGATHWADGSGDNKSKDVSSVSEFDITRAVVRKRQAAVMAKMKAAQERFAVVNQCAEEGNSQGREEEADAKRARKSEGGSDDVCKETQLHCALCLDSASASPLCFLTFIQKSNLLEITERTTPSWDHRTVVLPLQAEREGVAPGGPSTMCTPVGDGTHPNLQSTVELLRWMQETLVDAPTRTRLLEGENFFELLRNGLPLGLRNAVPSTPAVTSEATVAPSGDTESEEVESSCEITDLEISSEVGTSDTSDALLMNWWEDNHERTEKEGSSSNRDIAAETVLAEYVAVVSRPQALVCRGLQSSVQAPAEQGWEGNLTSARRATESMLHSRIGMNDPVGIYLSACGHAVHQDCHNRYFSSLVQRYNSRAPFEGERIVDLDLGEFLCPVCRRLANSVFPVLPGHTGLNSPFKTPNAPQISVRITPDSPTTLQLEHAFRMLIKAEELVSKSGFRKVVDPQLPDMLRGVLDDLAKRLWFFYPGNDQFYFLEHGRVHEGLLLWDVFRYTLMSAELAARSNELIVSNSSGLVTLVNVGDATHGSVLPLLLHAAKATQSQSRQAILLRARGLQLLMDSLANGISRVLSAEKALHGNVSSLLQNLDNGHNAADLQFWKRMADPILVHDSFSSFMWLLFCLPLPFPANGAPFTALVHLFYLVSITQIIAQAGTSLALDTELAPTTVSFVASIHASLIGTRLQSSSVDENIAIPAGPALVAIRRLTLPFLRRCYLLKTLITGSAQIVPIARAHQWELPQGHEVPTGSSMFSNDARDANSQILGDGEELDQLESIFCIPPLAKILEENAVQKLVLTWCRHVRTDTGMRYFPDVPRLTTAAPFRMMQLPRLFQDLLQRFVKERCRRCNSVPDKPALCLLCGALYCAACPKSICRQGELYRHAMVCGAGIGVFLMLRTTNIRLQRCKRQAMWPSPYLDDFGEEDIDLRRGKPLFLSQERYHALSAMVAAHGLDYSSPVLSHTTRESAV